MGDANDPAGERPINESSSGLIAWIRRETLAAMDAGLRSRAGLSWLEYATLVVLTAERDAGLTVAQLAERLYITPLTARRSVRHLLECGDLQWIATIDAAPRRVVVSAAGRSRALSASEHFLLIVHEQLIGPLAEAGIELSAAIAAIASHDL